MKLTKFFAFAFAALAFVACGEEPQSDTPKPTPNPTGGIKLVADKTVVKIGDAVTFTVFDAEGQDVTSQALIYDDELEEVDSQVVFNESGSYSFFASLGSKNSNYVTIGVMAEVPKGLFEVANVAICPVNDVVTYDYK